MFKLFLIAGLSFFNPRPDSIGTETINGKVFIIHQVSEKETLYGISKRYGVTVSQILEHNPTADAGLEIGQRLKVPYVSRPKTAPAPVPIPGGIVHKVAEKETLFSISRQYSVTVDDIRRWNSIPGYSLALGQELIIRTTVVETIQQPVVQNSSKRAEHTVAIKETLFGISRQYGVTVQQLKDWNSLAAEELSIGQVLVVSPPNSAVSESVEPQQPPVAYAGSQTEIVARPQESNSVITISESVKDKDEIRESGIAELIDGTEGNRKYLALHRTAPVGTILKVRNEMNNREVFVRVAGKLPDTAFTDRLVIKVSKSAYDRLGAIDSRFRVEVTYYK